MPEGIQCHAGILVLHLVIGLPGFWGIRGAFGAPPSALSLAAFQLTASRRWFAPSTCPVLMLRCHAMRVGLKMAAIPAIGAWIISDSKPIVTTWSSKCCQPWPENPNDERARLTRQPSPARWMTMKKPRLALVSKIWGQSSHEMQCIYILRKWCNLWSCCEYHYTGAKYIVVCPVLPQRGIYAYTYVCIFVCQYGAYDWST